MRDTVRRRRWFVVLVAGYVAASASHGRIAAQIAAGRGENRNFDARIAYNVGYRAPTIDSLAPALAALRTAVPDATATLVVAPEDPQALAQAISQVYEQPSLARTLGQSGRQYAETHFDKGRALKRFAMHLEHVARH